MSMEVYGEVKLKRGLTETQVDLIEKDTYLKFEVGEDYLSFEGEYFEPDDLLQRIKNDVSECDLQCIGRYEDTKITLRNGKLHWYSKEFLCDVDDKYLVEELKARGYGVRKKNEKRKRNQTTD